MQLSTLERLVLLQILPAQGDFTTLKIVRKLRESLSFTEEEHAILDLKMDKTTGEVAWKKESDFSREVDIGPKAHEIIAEQFRELDKKKKLRMEQMDLYERFVTAE